MLFLLESAADKEYDGKRFVASLHGIDLEKLIKEKASVDESGTPTKFREPGHYDHLPMEERKKMTEEMKSKFFSVASLTPLGGKDGR